MTDNGGPTGPKSRRLSPEELAREVARRLRLDRGGHRRRRFDIVSASRVAMVVGVILLGVGSVFAATWIGRLVGFETTGTVIEDTPVFGCPGEPEIGFVFAGETVHLVGRSDDGAWYTLRDERGPGDTVYADAEHITPGPDHEKLPVRDCDPRSAEEIAAEQITTSVAESTTTSSTVPRTTIPGETTTTVAASTTSRPPRRGTPSPGTTTTTTPPVATTTPTTQPTSTSSSTSLPTTSTTSTTQPSTTTTDTQPSSTTTTSIEITTTTTMDTTTTTSTTVP